MKRLALGALGLGLGCNQIFGLKQTQVFDAAVDAPPPIPQTTHLVWGIGQLDASGQPNPMLDYLGIGFEAARPEQPAIRVGPELDASGDATLADAVYDPSPSGADLFPGGFSVPDGLLGRHWRMVFTLPGDPLPREVQWTVSTAYLVIPRLTRRDAPPVPPNSGYSITPVNGPVLASPIIMTSGVWTWSLDVHYTMNTFLFDYSAAAPDGAHPLTGPAGAPEKAKGDWVLATEWQPPDVDESSVSGWALAQVDLAANVHQEPTTEPTWMTGTARAIQIQTNSLACNRLSGALSDFLASTTCASGTSRLEYGLLPAPGLPGFGADGNPLILPLDIANAIKLTLHVFDVDATVPLPHVLYSKLISTRPVAGVTLESSIEVVTQDLAGTLDYPAALTTNEELTDEQGGFTLPLNNDTQQLSSDTNPLLLKYTIESSAVATVDEIEITLYEIASATLTPIREYIVPDAATSVRIDRTLLKSGHTYVFALVTHRGYPSTNAGDYRAVTYPFGQSTKFSGAFTVQ